MEDKHEAVSFPKEGNFLKTLKNTHPRLLIGGGEIERVRNFIQKNHQAAQWHQMLREQARAIIAEPPGTYDIPDGIRLLKTSRLVLRRIHTLGLIWQLDGERACVERAWEELNGAAAFPDWNPSHFLDTAEMTNAFAFGYDWFFDRWTGEQRSLIKKAIITKGITPALERYRGIIDTHWVHAEHNWNQVCNGGIGMGALAIGDEHRKLAEEVLAAALPRLQKAMSRFAPDGGWDEGPVYWRYATQYNVMILAALESALGTDFGLSQMCGFSNTAWYPISLTGPQKLPFNFADARLITVRAPQMFWFSRKFDQPAFARFQRELAEPEPLDLLWFDPRENAPCDGECPTDRYFRGVEVVSLRTSWEDPQGIFVGFKGGDNKANHSNLDLGNFVLDALGQRWALDLGPDNYNLPGYWDTEQQRWTYYRMRAEGHNLPIIAPDAEPDQDPKATATLHRFERGEHHSFAIADLTDAYAGRAKRVHRGIALDADRMQVLVQDEIEAAGDTDIWWFMHTEAEIERIEEGTAALLKQGNAKLYVKILSPDGAKFDVMDARPLQTSPDPDAQANNEGVRKLAVFLENVSAVRVAVLMVPLKAEQPSPEQTPEVKTLAEWV